MKSKKEIGGIILLARDYREFARMYLNGTWLRATAVTLIMWILGGLVSEMGALPAFSEIFAWGIMLPAYEKTLSERYSVAVAMSLISLLMSGTINMFFSSVVGVGYQKYTLDISDHKYPNLGTLFCRFKKNVYMKSVKLVLLRGLFAFAGTLLFIIPGIIAGYSYYMAHYIMLDHPELTASECMKASRQLMRKNKWRLFCLHFSFIGWILACTFVCGIGILFLIPYMSVADAVFYRDISIGVNIRDLLDK